MTVNPYSLIAYLKSSAFHSESFSRIAFGRQHSSVELRIRHECITNSRPRRIPKMGEKQRPDSTGIEMRMRDLDR
jgi:hypothetical protein